MKNNERLKRNFVNYALQKDFNLSAEYENSTLSTINIKDKNDILICSLHFGEGYSLSDAPVLINYTKYISLDSVDKLASLFKKIVDLYTDLNDEDNL